MIANAGAIAFAWIAFVVGVSAAADVAARAIVSAAFFRIGAGLAGAGADVAAAKSIDAIVGEALSCGSAGGAVVIATNAFSVALPAAAFQIWIALGANQTACSICAAAFFGGSAGHACCCACSIATDAVDAVARSTLPTGYAGRAIDLQGLGLIAPAGTIAFTGIAFAFHVTASNDGSTDAIVTLPLFCFRAGVTHLCADVAAADAIDAIP